MTILKNTREGELLRTICSHQTEMKMSAEMYSDIVFLGDRLVPEVCTARMGIMPSKSYRKGQRNSTSHKERV